MGGNISVESLLDKGSTFSFTAKFPNQPLNGKPVFQMPGKIEIYVSSQKLLLLEMLSSWFEYWGFDFNIISLGNFFILFYFFYKNKKTFFVFCFCF